MEKLQICQGKPTLQKDCLKMSSVWNSNWSKRKTQKDWIPWVNNPRVVGAKAHGAKS